MKVIFMGTPDFAVPSLEALIEHHEVIGVVTQPDRPKGRGKKVSYSPVKELAMSHQIPVMQPNKIKSKEFTPLLEGLKADLFVVVAYGQILSKRILDMPEYGSINVHGSLLPEYRGAAPIHKAVLDGKDKTGVTIMYMDVGLDTGDMILKGEIPISSTDNTGIIHDKMSVLGAELLIEAINSIEDGTVTREKQDDRLSSYAPMLTKEIGLINWNNESHVILNQVRGLNPYPIAYTSYNGEILKIWNCKTYEGDEQGKIGEILENKDSLVVQTGDKPIEILEIQGRNGKKMNVSDYLRGHKMEKGSILE